MFQPKTLVAVVAGMAVAGAVLAAPPVAAAPDPGRPFAWGSNLEGQLGALPFVHRGSLSGEVGAGVRSVYCSGRQS